MFTVKCINITDEGQDWDALYEQVQCIMGNALTFSDKFMDYLLGILDGSRKAKDIMDILTNAGEND